jgi:hypothetical protein
MYLLIQIDPETGARIDTDDAEMTETQLDAFLANALEIKRDVWDGMEIYRFADGWYSYMTAA